MDETMKKKSTRKTETEIKGLILCAGKGTRLRPITHTSAKQLVPVANKPIIHFGLEAMRAAGITDIGIVVGDTGPEIKEALGDGAAFGVKLTYIRQAVPKGIAHAVLTAEAYLGKNPFVLYLGDNLLKDGITGLADEFRRTRPNATILLTRVKDPRQFGVAEVKGRQIVSVVEKPKKPKSDLAIVGVYIFDHNVMDAARRVKPSWRGELEITDTIALLLADGYKVTHHVITGWWKDTGKKEDMLEANRMVLEGIEPSCEGHIGEGCEVTGRVVIGAGAHIEQSTVHGPAIIGAGSIVRNAYIGPFTSLGENVIVENSEVANSILLTGSRISHLDGRLEESLLGKDVVVEKSPRRPRAYKMMLGDCSHVSVF
jgi:glucose-1-phosphate thymidylyltransferase